MTLAASPLSAARPLAPYLRIATQLPSPPTQPQARPRTAAALRPHGLHPSPDRKHGPAAIQPKTPGRGWRPAARSAPPALLGHRWGKGRACGRGMTCPKPRPLTGRGAEVGFPCDGRAAGGWGRPIAAGFYLRPAPRQWPSGPLTRALAFQARPNAGRTLRGQHSRPRAWAAAPGAKSVFP